MISFHVAFDKLGINPVMYVPHVRIPVLIHPDYHAYVG